MAWLVGGGGGGGGWGGGALLYKNACTIGLFSGLSAVSTLLPLPPTPACEIIHRGFFSTSKYEDSFKMLCAFKKNKIYTVQYNFLYLTNISFFSFQLHKFTVYIYCMCIHCTIGLP